MQTDRPIQSAAQDRFDRAPFAQRIADIIRHRSDPATLVVGIYGPWGDGKSSTLALIKEALKNADKVVQVDYNPWFFSSSIENLTRSFFLTLGETLEKASPFTREKIGALLKKYGGMVPKFGGLLKAAGDALSVTDLKTVRSQVEEILSRHKAPIVMFVDDIDRLDRKEIQALFKLIRLSADFPYVIYIMAFDDEIVSAALGEAYEGGDAAAGRRFLEKIIQVPLHLPRANPEALRKMAFEAVDAIVKNNNAEIAESDAYAFANNFVLSFASLMTTPRQVKLYENALTFAVPILAGETSLVDLLLLEAIRTFAPKLYLAIRDNQELFLQTRRMSHGDEKQKQLDSLLGAVFAKMNISEADSSAIRMHALQRLFPRTSNMGYGSEWDAIWAKDKHICVAEYFPRYFQYGVPTGDIADRLIQQAISAASDNTAGLGEVFSAIKARAAFPTFIRKLRIQEEAIPQNAVRPLVHAIATNANDLPREPSSMLADWTIMQAAILTSHLTQKLPDDDARYSLIRSAIERSSSFVYSVSMLQWTRKQEEKGEIHGFLEEKQINDLTQIIVEKLLIAAAGIPLYRFLGEDTPRVLLPWSWHGDPKALRTNIEESVAAEGADGAEALIQVCCGKSWEMQTGIPHVSDVRRDVYDTVAKFADPNFLMSILGSRYGAKLDDSTFHPDCNIPLGERLALQFAHVYHQSKQDLSKGTAETF